MQIIGYFSLDKMGFYLLKRTDFLCPLRWIPSDNKQRHLCRCWLFTEYANPIIYGQAELICPQHDISS